jgi:hypothetical protein
MILCKRLANFTAHFAKAGPSYVGRTIDVPNRPATGPYTRVRGRNGRSKYARYAFKRSGRPARLTARTPDLDRPGANSDGDDEDNEEDDGNEEDEEDEDDEEGDGDDDDEENVEESVDEEEEEDEEDGDRVEEEDGDEDDDDCREDVVEDGGGGKYEGPTDERIEGLGLRAEYGVKVGDKCLFGGSGRGREKDELEIESGGSGGWEMRRGGAVVGSLKGKLVVVG